MQVIQNANHALTDMVAFTPRSPRFASGDATGPLFAAGNRRRTRHGGFTLVEMLVVIGVIVLLLGLVIPAIGPLKGSQDVTTAAYNLANALQTARNYAMSNNTYTWIGFYEQDYANTSAPTTPQTSPNTPYKGIGHLTIGIVFSKDGTKLVDDTVSTSVTLPTTNTSQPSAVVVPVGKLLQIYGVHLKALDPPSDPNSINPVAANLLGGRPYQGDANTPAPEQSLINSESGDFTYRPFVTQGYTFYKTIRFNPRGEANINSTLPCTRIIEFGLQPTHGNTVAAAAPNSHDPPNAVAVQQAGIGGAVNIYRR